MKKGTLCLILGGLLLLAAVGLTGYNLWDSHRAEACFADGYRQVAALIPEERKPVSTPGAVMEMPVSANDESPTSLGLLYPDRDMPALEVDGVRYLGTLDIPDAGIHIPVTEDWSYRLLKFATCRFAGSVYQKNMVIAGHNYLVFSPIKTLPAGTEVTFIDAEGFVWSYQVAYLETLQPTQVEDLLEDPAEDWDLTLFTCSTGGTTRCAVRCIQIEE